ncbi:MAG TPA: glucokinase [Gammaproteobacteria bacterium]|nr:glucokinase [Gammaproteobacteria bacterium]
MPEWLLADIGGTHTRAACKRPGMPAAQVQVFRNRDYGALGKLLRHYLDSTGLKPQAAALAVASPVEGDEISLTNLNWTFSIESLRAQLGLDALHVFNDFTATALSLPYLDAEVCTQIGAGQPAAGAAVAVLGPGTGLGVSGLIPCGDAWAPIAGEGGHVTLAAATEEESRLFHLLQPTLGHVSAEKLLSGPGLLQLYRGLAELRGETAVHAAPEAVTGHAVDGNDPLAAAGLAMFFALLGGFAGDVALTLGARGGVWLAGGILPGLVEALRQSEFRRRFAAKGRFNAYLEAIPTYVITDLHPALVGLGQWLEEHQYGESPVGTR